jgi:hypothetical protein
MGVALARVLAAIDAGPIGAARRRWWRFRYWDAARTELWAHRDARAHWHWWNTHRKDIVLAWWLARFLLECKIWGAWLEQTPPNALWPFALPFLLAALVSTSPRHWLAKNSVCISIVFGFFTFSA